MPSPRVIALILASAIFMEQIDSTVLATALPTMARSFNVPTLSLSVAVTSYLLSLAVFIPVSGKIADKFGSKTVFRFAIALFTLGSILCGLSTSVWFLVLARILQGIGGGMMVPVGRLVLFRAVPKSEFVAMMAWVLVPAMLGPVLGPPLGGLIVSYLSWRWIFYVNVPLGIIGIVLTTLLIPQIKEPSKEPFDVKGSILSGFGLCCFVFGLESASRGTLPLAVALAILGASVVAGVLYWRHARMQLEPILDLRLYRIPTFSLGAGAGLLFRISFGALPFLLPLMMQLGFGLSAMHSGFITFSSALGALFVKPVAIRVLRLLGYRTLLLWNGLICTVFMVGYAFFRPEWPLALIYFVLVTGGIFRSMQYTAYGTLVYADIPQRQTSAAISFHSMLQQMSVTLGVAISAGVLSIVMGVEGHSAPTLFDFTLTFLVLAAISFFSVPMTLSLHDNAGAELSGRRAAPESLPVTESSPATEADTKHA